MDTVIVLEKFEVPILTHSRDNSDWSFGWGVNSQSSWRGGRTGSWWYRSKKRRWLPI